MHTSYATLSSDTLWNTLKSHLYFLGIPKRLHESVYTTKLQRTSEIFHVINNYPAKSRGISSDT